MDRTKLVEVCPEFCATMGAPAGVGPTVGVAAAAPDFGAPLGPTGAIFAKFEMFGTVPAAGDGAGAGVGASLLLNKILAFAFGATVGAAALVVGGVAAAGRVGAAAVDGALGTTPAADGRDG
jgi:hypothetical protein